MIAALAGLLFCQLLGEVLVRALSLPVPGPVAGLGLMFAFLLVRGRKRTSTGQAETESAPAIPPDLGRVADAFLDNLSLLFIPAAVGVVQYLGLLRKFAWPIALTIVVSTTAALAVTALVFRLAAHFQSGPLREDGSRDGAPKPDGMP